MRTTNDYRKVKSIPRVFGCAGAKKLKSYSQSTQNLLNRNRDVLMRAVGASCLLIFSNCKKAGQKSTTLGEELS